MTSNKRILLGVLNQAPLRNGKTTAHAIEEAILLAQEVDKLGYHRYWIAEHHNSSMLAAISPEPFLAHIGNKTSRIRIGAGGVLLPYYSALKVAESFNLLATLFPGRIDLGIGRGKGTSDLITQEALRHPEEGTSYATKLRNLIHYVRETTSKDAPDLMKYFKALQAPEIWLLGSSGSSAEEAVKQETCFSFAYFINPKESKTVLNNYRQQFISRSDSRVPCASVALYVCAADESELKQIQEVMDFVVLRNNQDVDLNGIPSYEDIKDVTYTHNEWEDILSNRQRMIVGTADYVKDRLMNLANECQADEILLNTLTPEFSQCVRSYKLLANAFRLV
jgi:luciferase family oxidoreductase group 1